METRTEGSEGTLELGCIAEGSCPLTQKIENQRSELVAQEEHLTIEQLSAYIDKQLSLQEQAESDAHMQRCRQCQNLLADLRQTVSLLHALPQPELPRSFVLSARTLSVFEGRRPAPVTPVTRSQGRSWQNYLRSSTRVISTIAAVLGVIFIMSSLLLSLPRGTVTSSGSAATTSAPAFSSTTSHPAVPAPTSANADGQGHNPQGTATSNQANTAPAVGPTPVERKPPTPMPTPANSQQAVTQPPPVPAIIDVSMPQGRLGVGVILFILGGVGVFTTRRRGR